jgi:hypothetical protein
MIMARSSRQIRVSGHESRRIQIIQFGVPSGNYLDDRVAGQSARRAFGLNSVALVALEPDEPVETVTVDDLSVGGAPRPRLQVVHDPAALSLTP